MKGKEEKKKDGYEMAMEVNRFCEDLHKKFRHLKPVIVVCVSANDDSGSFLSTRLYPNKGHDGELFEKFYDSKIASVLLERLDYLKQCIYDEDLLVEDMKAHPNYEGASDTREGVRKEIVKRGLDVKFNEFKEKNKNMGELARSYLSMLEAGKGKGLISFYVVKNDGFVDSFRVLNRMSDLDELGVLERRKFDLLSRPMADYFMRKFSDEA